jgi:uncharacterized phage infection (PIP) family protein YhgE
VVTAVVAVRIILQTNRLIETANQSLAQLPSLISELRSASTKVDDLLDAFSKITHSAQNGVSHFEDIASRTRGLASTLLDEVEQPIAKAAGVMRGIRVGASFLAQRWMKSRSGRTQQGGEDYVAKQRWLDDGGFPPRSDRGGWPGADLRPNGW